MTLSITNIGGNAQVPGITAQIFNPDQLIVDTKNVVTDTGVITGGLALKRGQVMGQVTVGAAAAAVAGGGNTGNGVISAISTGLKTVVGTYTILMTGATTYNIVNPNGTELKPGTAAGAYTDPQLNLTFTAGSTPMVAGDTFTIAVAAGSLSWKKSVATATDGSQVPGALLVDDADASGGDVNGGLYLMGEFNSNAITLDGSFTLAAAKALLAAANIYLKAAIPADDPS